MSQADLSPLMRPKRRRKRTKYSLATLLFLLIGLLGQRYGWFDTPKQSLQQNQPGLYQVVQFHDGDTIGVSMNGKEERIRMIGVDTPETQDPRKAVQCFGKAASAFTKQLIGNNQVRLESDPLSSNRDRYNRLLRYVFLPDSRLVNIELISHGYGFAYTSFPFTKSDAFKQAETTAREAGRGLWGQCQPTPNEYGGYTSNNE